MLGCYWRKLVGCAYFPSVQGQIFLSYDWLMVFCQFIFTLLFATVSSQWNFSHWKFELPSLGKASCDRVAPPNLQYMLDVLEFPSSTEL